MVLGVWQKRYAGTPDDVDVTDQEVQACVDEINERHPGLRLHPGEVVQRNTSLSLLTGRETGTSATPRVAPPRIVDHSALHGTLGIISLVGSEWGTARADAARVVDEVLRRTGTRAPASSTSAEPVHGGDTTSLDDVVQAAHEASLPWGFTRDRARDLVRDHGTGYREVLDLLDQDASLVSFLPGTRVLRAEVVHAVRSEMALTLDDVVHRRTRLGLEGRAHLALEEAALLMSTELGWSADRTEREVAHVSASLPRMATPSEHARV